MADCSDILWNLYQEHCTWERHHESQRATATNVLVIVTAGILSVIAFDKEINNIDLPLTIFMTLQGIFGTLFTAKHYERFCMHQERANQYRNALDTMFPSCQIKILREMADIKIQKKFPILYTIRLHTLWNGIHILISVFGFILTLGIILEWFLHSPK